MKRIGWILLLACGIAGCGQGHKDSLAKADSTNMKKDSANNTLPVAAGVEISGDDAKFADRAAAGGLAEVTLGKLAQQKGGSQAIRDFGSMMVKDHSTANTELAGLAKRKHIVLPQQLDEEAQKLQKDLSGKTGKEFDKSYVEAMVKDHKEDTTDFVRAIKILKYPEMAAFAKKTLPVLKMHLATAEKIKSTF